MSIKPSLYLGLLALSTSLYLGCACLDARYISQEDAEQAALKEVDGEIIGIRFDEPDSQWDVFVSADQKAYEIEIDATNGTTVAVEEEDLAQIKAELSGDLSHEGVKGDED
jgi:hypothetical protein